MANEFDQLFGASFRGASFPVTEMSMRIAHDLVRHQYWSVDGSRVEDTGLAPVEVTFTVPMFNTIFPGKHEGWTAGDLYPNGMRQLLAAFRQRSTGVLVHPEFGAMFVKANEMQINWNGGNGRDGVTATLSFVETITDDQLESFLQNVTPTQDMADAADDLDANMVDLRPLVPGYFDEPAQPSFSDFVRSITSVFDQATLLSYRQAGQIDALVYQANRLQDSIERSNSALTWPATRALEVIKSSTFTLREKLLAADRTIVLFPVRQDTTLAGLSVSLGDTSIADVIRLNPGLVGGPIIAQGTVVRYYRPKAAA